VTTTQNNSFLAIDAHICTSEDQLAKSWNAVIDAIQSVQLHALLPQPPPSTGLGCLADDQTTLGALKLTWAASHQNWQDDLQVTATGPDNGLNRESQ
jgi:hypothetical protein